MTVREAFRKLRALQVARSPEFRDDLDDIIYGPYPIEIGIWEPTVSFSYRVGIFINQFPGTALLYAPWDYKEYKLFVHYNLTGEIVADDSWRLLRAKEVWETETKEDKEETY